MKPVSTGFLKWNSRTGELWSPSVFLVVTHTPFGRSQTLEVGVRVPLAIYSSMVGLVSQETNQVAGRIEEELTEDPLLGVTYLQDLEEMMLEGEGFLNPVPESYQDYPEWGSDESRDRLVWGLCVLTNALVRTGLLEENEVNGVRIVLEG